jgi:hypothetical protein
MGARVLAEKLGSDIFEMAKRHDQTIMKHTLSSIVSLFPVLARAKRWSPHHVVRGYDTWRQCVRVHTSLQLHVSRESQALQGRLGTPVTVVIITVKVT